MKTPAAILVEQQKPLILDEVTLPSLSYGHVLVELKVSRICGSQIGEIDGVKGPDRYLPHLLGHEGGGVVLEIGPEVTHVKPGDHVVLHWREGVGIQSRAPVYDWNGVKTNGGYVTTFNRYAVVSENRLTPIPSWVSFDIAALLADTLTTGFGVVTNDAQVKIGESVVIVGAGGIGLGAILGAKLAGAYPIVAVDLHAHKLEVAHRYGATHVIDVSGGIDFTAAVREILKGRSPDVVIDGTGNPEVLEKAFGLTASKGRCVIFGVMRFDRKLALNTLPLHFGKLLTGSHGGASQPSIDIPRYLRMIEGGIFDPSGFVSHRFRLEEVNEGIARMRSGEVIHAMIDF
ncbi:S-(hydroxymethyl)glutathione dehydrogenase / alcohol dehydrogenase [Verrucomicrobium sp. GAS474]|uniref:zinc-binding dehydrogenase n=1 Tax=Verrucomicrobium sp. GAS474 TaxID=1882831 RepID=UPI00087DC200|nr:zinc-binding dehydrogenase [Verrucomicrobium sp. GAS474]SDT94617.1 S-(hydroxymethyl)glutathione dehydrogenase / alcohol dehydrogenase [Verrucomicrobium sp. GAS474]